MPDVLLHRFPQPDEAFEPEGDPGFFRGLCWGLSVSAAFWVLLFHWMAA